MPLVFPDFAEDNKDPNELQFRDGKRSVAPYLAALMTSLDTERYTYEEAIAAVNHGLEGDHLTTSYDKLVKNHLSKWGR